MADDWWPSSLAHIPKEEPWGHDHVVVAEIRSFEDGSRSGIRITVSALVPASDLDAIRQNPAILSHEITTSGPHPFPSDKPFEPRFWIEAYGLTGGRYEPLILSWRSHDKTILTPDPGFLMTYGLSPRNIGSDAVSWDDPAAPVRDVVKVVSPSTYSFPRATHAYVSISKSYLQDYLTLRRKALVQSFLEQRFSSMDAEIEERLAGKQIVDLDTSARRMRLFHLPGAERVVSAEASGSRILAVPGLLPITEDAEQTEGLIWPGIDGPVDHTRAMRMLPSDCVYVDDRVLADYEGRPEYNIHPESGSVEFGTQWAIGYCNRAGRDLIRLELKKLYEGVRPYLTRHWHKFAANPPEGSSTEIRSLPNVATRARALTYAVVGLGEGLSALAQSVGLSHAPTNFVGLERSRLDHSGWWTFPSPEAVARHMPKNMSVDAFLDRCLALNKLLIEGIQERSLRETLLAMRAPKTKIEKLGSLKLLDCVVRLCQVANSTGLGFNRSGREIWKRLSSDGTSPAQPISLMFAVYDARLLKAHKSEDQSKLAKCLSRFGVDVTEAAAGYGLIADRVYDRLIAEVESVTAKIQAARVLAGRPVTR